MKELTTENMTTINLSSKMCYALGSTFLECQEEGQDVVLIFGVVITREMVGKGNLQTSVNCASLSSTAPE